ncbi:MAG: sel1 repeat family protein [Kiloniellales bacterium]|nr:sel1 repeat family protein [Kiloniellales bacterium]
MTVEIGLSYVCGAFRGSADGNSDFGETMKRLRLVAHLALALVLLLPVPRLALADLAAATAAFESGDYASALTKLQPLADGGNAQAQAYLGRMHREALGVPRDFERSAAWYLRAAEQGHVEAQSMIGIYYAEGFGLEQDYQEAFRWLSKAAEQGDAQAQNSLGALYKHALGVENDDALAVVWYRRAAKQGHPLGQKNLATMYERGRGVPENKKKAYLWYHIAAENGLAEVRTALLRLRAALTPEEVEALENLAEAKAHSDLD